jgi:hypothetical protein
MLFEKRWRRFAADEDARWAGKRDYRYEYL